MPIQASIQLKNLDEALGLSADASIEGLRIGNPDSAVTGIGVTWMATRETVLETARRGLNILISHEPTFYHPEDDFTAAEADFAFVEKMQEILKNSILLYRFHDSCIEHPRFGISSALASQIGFGEPLRSKNGVRIYAVVPDSLSNIASIVKQRLDAPYVSTLGSATAIERIATVVGRPLDVDALRQCMRMGAKCVIAGGAEELALRYAEDSKLSLILCGDCYMDRPGLRLLTEFLGDTYSELPVEYIENSPSLKPL